MGVVVPNRVQIQVKMGVVVPNRVQILEMQVVQEVQIRGIQGQIRGIQVLVVEIQEIVGQIQIIQVVREVPVVREVELILKPTQQTLQQHLRTVNQVEMVELPTQLQTLLRLHQVVLHQMRQKVVVVEVKEGQSQMLGLVQ